MKEKVDCHPNQEVLLLSVLLAESHHQVHPPADQIIKRLDNLTRKAENRRTFS